MAFLETLSTALQMVTNLLPRLYFCPAYLGGVLFIRGKPAKQIDRGALIYWPFTTSLEVCPITRQVLPISAQTCSTADGKTIVLAGVLTYKVVDVSKFLADNYEADESVAEIVSSVLRDVVSEKDWSSLQDNNRNVIDNALKRKASDLLSSYGVEVERLRITSLAPARVIQLFGHSPLSNIEKDS
jgi:regulator of protease activity HflC (stomatin/prohibitin superfamily)